MRCRWFSDSVPCMMIQGRSLTFSSIRPVFRLSPWESTTQRPTFQPQKDDTDVQWHFILWLAVLAMPIAIFSTTLLYIVGPAVLLALLFFNLTFIALGSSYVPTEELLDKEEENNGSSRTRYMRSGGIVRFLPKKQDHFCRVWILLSHSSLPNLQDKRRLFSYRMERLPIYRCSTK